LKKTNFVFFKKYKQQTPPPPPIFLRSKFSTFFFWMEQLLRYYHVSIWALCSTGGSSNWVHTTRIHSIQRLRHFGAKTSWSAFLVEKQLRPLYIWIQFTWSGSTHMLYYLKMLINQNTVT
jgi:hypothetical protein